MSTRASLICYVGNGVVKAAIVAYAKKGDTPFFPTILTTRVRDIPYQEFTDREHLEFRVISEFTALIKDVKLKDLGSDACKGCKLADASIVLSSPWYVSETKHIIVENEKPFEVNERMIDDAIVTASSSYTDIQKEKISILEKRVIHYLLNGYPTEIPIKKSARSLEMNVFLSFCKTTSISTLKDILLSHLNLHDVSIHSQSLAAFSAIRNLWKDAMSYVLTDITSQLTELMIVRNDSLAEAASFPYGKQYVIKELGKKLNTTGDVSQSLLDTYHKGFIDEILKKKIEIAIDEIRKEWLVPFTKSLGDMSSGSSLPSRFILFAPSDIEWLFTDFIKSEEYQQFTFSEGKFDVHEMKAEDFEGAYTTSLGVEKDMGLVVGSIFHRKNLEGVQ